ncbi:MAG: DMT family transporter [Burkholderiaceae bacterium]
MKRRALNIDSPGGTLTAEWVRSHAGALLRSGVSSTPIQRIPEKTSGGRTLRLISGLNDRLDFRQSAQRRAVPSMHNSKARGAIERVVAGGMPALCGRIDEGGILQGSQNAPLLAAALAIGAAVVLPIADSEIKRLVVVYPVLIVAWIRLALMSAFVGAIAIAAQGRQVFRPAAPGLQAARASLALFAIYAFYRGLEQLPLGESTAVMCLAVPLATASSHWLLKEHATPMQWAGVLICMIGAALVLRPGDIMFTPAALWPLLGATCWAGFINCSRFLGRVDHPMTTTFWTCFGGLVILSVALLVFGGRLPDFADTGRFLAIGALGTLGQLMTAAAYRYGPAPLVAPIGYLSIAVAALLGWVRFGDALDWVSVIGMAGITAGGALVVSVDVNSRAMPAPERAADRVSAGSP